MTTLSSFEHLADDVLVAETKRLAANERVATARLIAALAELDERKLYRGEGCSSLFVYCTRVLHLSEHAAYSRIEAARAARRFPPILELLNVGDLTLTNVTLLAPHLTDENCAAALEAARHRSKREVEVQVAALRPQPPIAPSIRKVPTRQALDEAARPPDAQRTEASATEPIAPAALPPVPASAKRALVRPLAPEHYRVQFTISRDTHDKLRRAQDLLRHAIPDGNPAKIFDRALTLLLADVERKKVAAVAKPRDHQRQHPGTGRHVPAGVRREVWKRDGGQCAFVGREGRCGERGFLEFHHRRPFASGGETTVDNLELRCHTHNAYEAELFFAPFVARDTRECYGITTRSGPSSRSVRDDCDVHGGRSSGGNNASQFDQVKTAIVSLKRGPSSLW